MNLLPTATESVDEASEEGWMGCVSSILNFIIEIVEEEESPGYSRDVNTFVLQLLNVAFNSGGEAFQSHENLMRLIRENLFPALFKVPPFGGLL